MQMTTQRNLSLAQKRRQLDEAMGRAGTVVAVALKAKCSVCGSAIDLSVRFPVHACPSIPKVEGVDFVKSIVGPCGEVVIVASSRQSGIAVANCLAGEYGVYPLLIIPCH